jgi:hypothetical protein
LPSGGEFLESRYISRPAMIETLKEKIRKVISPGELDQKSLAQRDAGRVEFAASLLQISEFRFFKIAYFRWFGRNIDESSLEYIFDDFMFENIVPHYVRHFAREVLSLFEKGTLDPKQFGINRPAPTPELRSAGIGYTVMLFVILVIFVLLITDHIPYH